MIDEHELVSISFHLTQEYGSEIQKDILQNKDANAIENVDKTLEKIVKYPIEKRIEILLSLYLFFLHEGALSKHPRMIKIFEELELREYLQLFDDIFNNQEIHLQLHPSLRFYKKSVEIPSDLFERFEYILFEIGNKYRFVLRKGENLFIDEHHIKSKNRAIVLNSDQKFTFENKNSSLELSYAEMLSFLKGESGVDICKNIVQTSEVKIYTDEKIKKIEIKNLYCGFDKKKPRTKNLNISVAQKDLVAIIGPSGSGKSTLLKTIMGMNYIHGGSLTINDAVYSTGDEEKLCEYIGHIGYVSQHELFVKELSVYDNLYYYYSLFHTQKREKKVFEAEMLVVLKQLGIYEQLHQHTQSLSGGQKKKLNIALELIKNPDVLFIDEPTSGLSSQEAVELIAFLRELAQEGKMIFTVIHQPSLEMYQKYTKVIILNQDGYNIYSGDTKEALNIFCSVLSENNKDADPNILLKANKEHEDFWYTLGYIKRFLGAIS